MRDLEIDVVIPIPDSSRPSALELAQELGVPYREGFIKNRYIGRTFIMPGQAMRRKIGAPEAQRDGDGVQGQERAAGGRLDRARHHQPRDRADGARVRARRKVFFASAAPPVRFPNVYGIDMPTRDELIATGRSEEEIAREIGADALIYQDLDALIDAVRSVNPKMQQLRDLVLRRRLHHRRRHAGIPGRCRSVAARPGKAAVGCSREPARSGARGGGVTFVALVPRTVSSHPIPFVLRRPAEAVSKGE